MVRTFIGFTEFYAHESIPGTGLVPLSSQSTSTQLGSCPFQRPFDSEIGMFVLSLCYGILTSHSLEIFPVLPPGTRLAQSQWHL